MQLYCIHKKASNDKVKKKKEKMKTRSEMKNILLKGFVLRTIY